KRQLERWRADREQNGGLPLEDLLEMAVLPDATLDSGRVGQGLRYLYGLEEWGIVGRSGTHNVVPPRRASTRFAAALTPAQRARALQAEGLAFSELTPAQQAQYVQFVPQEWLTTADTGRLLAGARLGLGYSPAGWYEWSSHPYGPRYPLVA